MHGTATGAAAFEDLVKPQTVPGTTMRTRAQAAAKQLPKDAAAAAAAVPGTAQRARRAAAKQETAAPKRAAGRRAAAPAADADGSAQIVLEASDADEAGEQPSAQPAPAAAPSKDHQTPEVPAAAAAEKGLPPLSRAKSRRSESVPQPEPAAHSFQRASPSDSAAQTAVAAPTAHTAAGAELPSGREEQGRKSQPQEAAQREPGAEPVPEKEPAQKIQRATRASRHIEPPPPPLSAPGAQAEPTRATSDNGASPAAEQEAVHVEADGDDGDVFEEAHDEVFETPSSHDAFATPGSGPATSFATARQEATAYKTSSEHLLNSACPFLHLPLEGYCLDCHSFGFPNDVKYMMQ